VLRIMPDKKPSKLARLKKRTCVVGDLASIVHVNWLKEWSETKRLVQPRRCSRDRNR